MFWKLTALSASSPVESILDKENFTLEELLDEEEIIQECKALNSRLINFLRDRAQVEQLLRYIVEESPENAESKQEFKFPFIACEVFTCEIDVILKTLVEEEELMDLLFSFLEPNRPHSMLLAGYFSKVVVCLMMRKTVALMNYVQGHQDVLSKLVDLIGITSIMEILVRLVGADDHVYPNFVDVMHWLSESYLLEMIVDKLNPSCPPEVHSNAAETLCAIACNAPSALATKLSSPSFVARIFGHALEDSSSKSSRVHSLGVLISLLDPKRSSAYSQLFHSYKNQHVYQYPVTVDPETINAMLPKLGDLLMLLNVSSNETVLPTSYGELRPPLGKYRLKIVEFIAVLLKPGNEAAERELVISGMIKRIIDLFFEYPYNNALHHHVESIILSCLESKNDAIVDHLFQECDLVGKFLQVDKSPTNLFETNKPTLLATGKWIPRPGNMGHITRISNKLVQLGKSQRCIEAYLLENIEWTEWQATVLLERNVVENVYRWACGRPTALQERIRDSDEDDLNDRDYDIPGLANNLSHPFRYRINENEDATEDHRALDRDDEGDYYDDESAEVVISSLSLGDNQGSSLFTNSNWFAFEDNKIDRGSPVDASMSEMMDVDEIVHLNGTLNGGGNSSSDDEVVVGADEEMTDGKNSVNGTSTSCTTLPNGSINPTNDRETASNDLGFFKFDTSNSRDLFGDRSLPDWVEWGDSSDFQVGGSSKNPFEDHDELEFEHSNQVELAEAKVISPTKRDTTLQNGSPTSRVSSDGSSSGNSNTRAASVPSLFEEDVEFVGVELEGTEKAMDHALKEGIVGEAGPLKRNMVLKAAAETDNSEEGGGGGNKEFNDANYWRVDQEVAILE